MGEGGRATRAGGTVTEQGSRSLLGLCVGGFHGAVAPSPGVSEVCGLGTALSSCGGAGAGGRGRRKGRVLCGKC